jgi:beta-keto acid cleavage enzyme
MANKLIISCAITGSIHTPTMSEAPPITPDQIAAQVVEPPKPAPRSCICTRLLGLKGADLVKF